jgi:hypothetical protein
MPARKLPLPPEPDEPQPAAAASSASLRNKQRPGKPAVSATKSDPVASAAIPQPKRHHGFQKGQSGNPAGRKPGEKNRSTIMAEQLLKDSAQEVVSALVAAAKKGDVAAQTFIVRRLVPVRHGYPLQIDLPPISKADDLVAALSVIAQQMATGKLTPEEAAQAVSVLEVHRKAIETADLEKRLKAVEAAQEAQQQRR